MQKLCPDCLYIGNDRLDYPCDTKRGFKWIGAGLISILLLFITPYLLIFSWFCIVRGLEFIYACYGDPNKCPKCDHEALLDLDQEHAKQIIKENNLKIPSFSDRLVRTYFNPVTSSVMFATISGIISMIMLALLLALVL